MQHLISMDEPSMQENNSASGDILAASADAVAEHVKKLLHNPKIPELTPELAAVPILGDIQAYIIELRQHIGAYAKGDFSNEIKLRGVLAGMLKSIQANMQHLIWQMEQVEAGDLTQRVDFMGEFSNVFNSMVRQLDDALTTLHHKEQELRKITQELQLEVEKRGAAMSALQKSEENFKYLAEHDPLTTLLNRRSFFAQAEVELARNTIMDHPSAIALMDVDYFKRFNDTYGHLNGDQALRHIAMIGNSTLRSNDIMGRLGGEEFVFFFSKADLERGAQAAERVRKIIETNPVELKEGDIPITASFGVVSIPPGFGSGRANNIMQQAIDMADKALYESKSLGRNRVSVAEFTL